MNETLALSHNRIALVLEKRDGSKYLTIIDAQDYPTVGALRWHHVHTGRTDYAKNQGTYLHRVILPGTALVDHKDHDGLNNTRSNLRPATHSENHANSPLLTNNTSGFKGVYWSKEKNKWQAQITIRGHRQNLGRYATPELAAEAYNKAASEAFGAHARLNEVT
jgi:AP2 domain/HNH endonuclease